MYGSKDSHNHGSDCCVTRDVCIPWTGITKVCLVSESHVCFSDTDTMEIVFFTTLQVYELSKQIPAMNAIALASDHGDYVPKEMAMT